MDQDGDAGFGGELALDVGEVGAVADLHGAAPEAAAQGTREAAAELLAGAGDVIGGDHDAADSLGAQQVQDPGQRHLPDRVLTAGHGDRAVVQQLQGHIDAGGHQRAHGQRAGVEERAVAEVLHQVALADERAHAYPVRALAAHLRGAGDVADAVFVHEQHHRVAADARADQAVAGHARRRVVGAAGAEVRRAGGHRQGQCFATDRRGSRSIVRDPESAEHLRQCGRDVAGGFQARTMVRFVQGGLHRLQEEGALVLDDDDLVEPGGEVVDLLGVQRPRHAQAQHADAVGGA